MVQVHPLTEAWADALAQGDDVFAARFGVAVEENWAGFPDVIPHLPDMARSGTSPAWGTHLVFDDDGALVGIGGWKGEPVDGVAELGYAVSPARQGRGVATAVVRELLRRARAAGLRMAVAHTLAEMSASTSVLQRCGFDKVEELVDADEGSVWRWEAWLEEG